MRKRLFLEGTSVESRHRDRTCRRCGKTRKEARGLGCLYYFGWHQWICYTIDCEYREAKNG